MVVDAVIFGDGEQGSKINAVFLTTYSALLLLFFLDISMGIDLQGWRRHMSGGLRLSWELSAMVDRTCDPAQALLFPQWPSRYMR